MFPGLEAPELFAIVSTYITTKPWHLSSQITTLIKLISSKQNTILIKLTSSNQNPTSIKLMSSLNLIRSTIFLLRIDTPTSVIQGGYSRVIGLPWHYRGHRPPIKIPNCRIATYFKFIILFPLAQLKLSRFARSTPCCATFCTLKLEFRPNLNSMCQLTLFIFLLRSCVFFYFYSLLQVSFLLFVCSYTSNCYLPTYKTNMHIHNIMLSLFRYHHTITYLLSILSFTSVLFNVLVVS